MLEITVLVRFSPVLRHSFLIILSFEVQVYRILLQWHILETSPQEVELAIGLPRLLFDDNECLVEMPMHHSL